MTINALLIYNLKDDSALIRPLLEISLADNLQLDLFWIFAVGEKPDRDPVSGLPVVRSEFGAAGKSGGMFLRWYFDSIIFYRTRAIMVFPFQLVRFQSRLRSGKIFHCNSLQFPTLPAYHRRHN